MIIQKGEYKLKCFEISIEGIVQGVGFRPFIYNFARSVGYKGNIRNTSSGVIITIECDNIDYFLSYINSNSPPLAKIYSIRINEKSPQGLNDFTIIQSTDESGFTHLSPDISVCNECLDELIDKSNRRYLYPFINCINCGPRYSIIKKIPYDRENTTMSVFQMCDECLSEYYDISNRRFHAQPNACHKCGPKLKLIIDGSEYIGSNEDIIKMTIELLKHGAIVALKGIGGFHLACDASNEAVIKKLRERKRRVNKPFALMAANLAMIKRFCDISPFEEILLNDNRRPIVLLRKNGLINLPDDIAPKNHYLGFMLPYTPLHYLLFHYPKFNQDDNETKNFSALVMTSGNVSEEPIVKDNEAALSNLFKIADVFLLHNRDIFMRVDDSVVKSHNSKLVFIRRSRGYVPQSVQFKHSGLDVIGSGADIKSTFTLVRDGQAIISHHIGDLENIETIDFFEESFNNLSSVYRVSPVAIAHDLHPGYHSVRWALKYAQINKIKSYGIQHHYAHIASVMAENNITEKIIGIALDGNGYGTDGNLWGGEFMVCDIEGFERLGHFRYIPLPGGEIAIKECWRCALSYLRSSIDDDSFRDIIDSLGFIRKYGDSKINNILKIINKNSFSPLSSGAGRLFDAISAIIGLVEVNTFEGEAAIALESILDDKRSLISNPYPYDIKEGSPYVVDFSKMIMCIVDDVINKKDLASISLKFHKTIVEIIKDMAQIMRNKTGINKVAMSGGVFQNKYILENANIELSKSGFEVFINEKVPCNDGGISLGQAYIVNYKINHDRPK